MSNGVKNLALFQEPKSKERSKPQPAVERALAAIETAAGGRDQLLTTLNYLEANEPEQLFLDLLADPANQRDSLAVLAHASGMRNVKQVLSLLSRAKGAQAFIHALERVNDKIPEVAADIVAKAVDREVWCRDCQGGGKRLDEKGVAGELICQTCRGQGQFTQEADLERQKIALQMVGLLKKGDGVVVNTQINSVPIDTVLSRFVAATDKLVYGSRPAPIEAEVVKPASDEPA